MKKLFTSDKFFLAMVLCALIGETVYSLVGIFIRQIEIQPRLVLLLRLICVIVLYISYKKHNKNVMKGMMGALLMAQLITAILYLPEVKSTVEYISTPIFTVLSCLLFINHFIINSDRKSNPAMITINRIILVLLVINTTVRDISWIIADNEISVFLANIFDIIGFTGMHAVVVCVESRLDAYRLDREAAGWTEEKGYPKDYVHAYEKNKK